MALTNSHHIQRRCPPGNPYAAQSGSLFQPDKPHQRGRRPGRPDLGGGHPAVRLLGKYGNISDRLRSLAAEYRRPDTAPTRRDDLKRQIILFHRRVTAVWLASALLSLAIVAFVGTVLSVIFAMRQTQVGIVGAATLIIGLVLVGAAVLTDLYEIRLARLTIAGELADIFPDSPIHG